MRAYYYPCFFVELRGFTVTYNILLCCLQTIKADVLYMYVRMYVCIALVWKNGFCQALELTLSRL